MNSKTWRKIACLALLLAVIFACKRKDEVSYSSIEGRWYLYAAYRAGHNTDILPMAHMFGYGCIDDMELFVGADTFAIVGTGACTAWTMHGTYTMSADTIAAYDDNGDPVQFSFDDGVLATVVNIDMLGDVDLRFQKK